MLDFLRRRVDALNSFLDLWAALRTREAHTAAASTTPAGDLLTSEPTAREYGERGELIRLVTLSRAPSGLLLLEIETTEVTEPYVRSATFNGGSFNCTTHMRIDARTAAQLGRALSIEAARAAVKPDDPEYTAPTPVSVDARAPTSQGTPDPSLGKFSLCGSCGARWAWIDNTPPEKCSCCDATLPQGRHDYSAPPLYPRDA